MAEGRVPAIEDVEANDPGEVLPFVYAITSYGADYPVDGLVKRLRQGDIEVPAFQRSYVWNRPQADRFIESLLLGLPVPGIFLAVEDGSNRLLVVDGQQRLTTLRRFYDGRWDDSVYRLRNVQTQFRGKTYEDLPDEDRRRIDDAILHATIVRQEEPSEDSSSIFFVFERLNSGGVVLTPQEIRNSIYQGAFRDLLEELAHYPAWLLIFGRPSHRLKDRELILRFLALLHNADAYRQPMKLYLNKFMGSNRDLHGISGDELRKDFEVPVDLLAATLGRRAFRIRTALNAAVFDSVMIGIARRLRTAPIESYADVQLAYEQLLQEPAYAESVRKATANEDNVARRLRLATEKFAQVR